MSHLHDPKKIPVEEFTSPTPITVDKNAAIEELVVTMRENGFRHLPVVENEAPVGIISDRDVKFAAAFKEARTFKAGDLMTPQPYTVSPETPLDEVVFEMSKHKMGSAIVQNADGSIYGIFTSTDALNALIEVLRGDV